MKIKSLLMAVVAGAALLVSCEQKEELGPAKLTLDPAALNFEAEGGSQNVELLATRTWQVDSKPDWVRLGTENGEASSSKQTVSVSVEANTGNDRTGSVVFTIGMMKSSLSVTQKGAQGQYVVEDGDGSQDKPFSVAQAADAVKDLTWTSSTEYQKVGPYYVKGKVSSIKENYSSEFGNAQFNISDDGTTAGAQFTAFRVKFLGNKGWVAGNAQVAVGDVVVIYGEIMNYKGNTPETVQAGSYLYSLNGETGSQVDPEDPDKVQLITCSEFIEKADPNTTYRLVGKVTSNVNATYCSFDMNDGTATVVVWTVNNKDEWKDKVKKDGTVTVRGKYQRYEKDGNVKHEMVDAYIEDFVAAGGGEDPEDPSEYVSAPAKTVAEFIQEANTTTYYKLSGTVGGKINTQYGNFDLTDATGTIYVYGCKNVADFKDKLVDGAQIVLAAKYMLYQKEGQADKHEAVEAYIISVDGGETPDPVSGTVTEAISVADDTPVTISEAVVAALSSKGFIATDGTSNVYVYLNAAPTQKVGDKVKIEAKKTTYYGLPELVNPTVSAISSGNEVPRTELKDITDDIDSYSADVAEYITVTGTLVKDGNFWNVEVEGATRKATPSSLHSSIDPSSLQNQEVIMTGYFNTIHSTKNLVQIVVTEIVAADYVEPTMDIDIVATENGFDASWEEVEGTDYYYWWLMDSKSQVVAEGYLETTSVSTFGGEHIDEEDRFVEWEVESLSNGKEYTLIVGAYANTGDPEDLDDDEELGYGVVEFIAINSEEPGPDPEPGDEDEIVFVFKDIAEANGWVDKTKYASVTIGDVTLTANGGGNTGKYYDYNASSPYSYDWRFYQSENASITVSSARVIDSITFTYGSKDSGVLLSPDGSQQIASDEEVEVGAASATYPIGTTDGTTKGKVFFTKIVVKLQ